MCFRVYYMYGWEQYAEEIYTERSVFSTASIIRRAATVNLTSGEKCSC